MRKCNYIVWGTNGKCPKAKHAGPYPGCFDFPVKQKDKFHLTGKLTPLMEELVQIVPEGSVILDPFVPAAGTTCVATKKHKCTPILFYIHLLLWKVKRPLE